MLPTLFLSHGSPMLLIEDGATHRFLRELGQKYPHPQAVVMISAHWENGGNLLVGKAAQPRTIHDFGGFPRELYEIRYPAHGAPELADEVTGLLNQAGLPASASEDYGLDHGAWVPLKLMYPDADIPVFQISLERGIGPTGHYRIGQALQSLPARDVLVIGSGSMTHNLYEYMGRQADDPAPAWVTEFETWMADALTGGRLENLLDYRTQAPHAARNHPTEEHLLPLFVAMGAAGRHAVASRIHAAEMYGVISMDAYSFAAA
jgi:4,5-DOPA dioxygenase extradiol